MKPGKLNVAYKNENIRIFKLEIGFVVESVNKVYKKLGNAIKKADRINMDIEIGKMFGHLYN